MKDVEQIWYQTDQIPPFRLRLLSWIFGLLAALRRLRYRLWLPPPAGAGVPIIVVGNITAGGSGKSPFIIWLADALRKKGLQPGIISRGYGGQASSWPQLVRPDADARAVGDEAIMIARRTGCPMVVGPNRVKAARALRRQYPRVDVILSDDGLQHYRMRRRLEIVIIDGERRFGNGYLLPAGPLREPVSRLDRVDMKICNGGEAEEGECLMQLRGQTLHAVNQPASWSHLTLKDLSGQQVHAVAGIGNPERFFHHLEAAGLVVIRHPFPDHFRFSEEDINFDDELPVLMTEKDAVKCERFKDRPFWYLAVDAEFSVENSDTILKTVIDRI